MFKICVSFQPRIKERGVGGWDDKVKTCIVNEEFAIVGHEETQGKLISRTFVLCRCVTCCYLLLLVTGLQSIKILFEMSITSI